MGTYHLQRMGDETVDPARVTMLLEQGRISGRGFCNNYFASQTATLPALKIGPVGTTRMACPEPLMAQDTAYIKALNEAQTASFADGKLTISGDGSPLVYQLQVQADEG